jgi:hypothetical protein
MLNIYCTKTGKHTSKAHIRKGGSQKTACPFDCRLYRRDSDTFELQVLNPTHNHEAYEDVLGDSLTESHSTLQRKDPLIMAKIAYLHRANIPPRTMLTTIHLKFPGYKVTSKDIYNKILKLRKEQLAGLTSIKALLYTLQQSEDWLVDYEINKASSLTHLFFAYRPGTKLY